MASVQILLGTAPLVEGEIGTHPAGEIGTGCLVAEIGTEAAEEPG